MAFKTFQIEMWGDYAPPQTVVRIKRQLDRKFYDAADKTFKNEEDCKNVFVKLFPSTSPNAPNSSTTDIDIDPKQFLDGDYVVYFHDDSTFVKKMLDTAEVTIFDADAAPRKCPYSTEIAGRMLDGTVASHKVPGSVGAWMIDVTARLDRIEEKLRR